MQHRQSHDRHHRDPTQGQPEGGGVASRTPPEQEHQEQHPRRGHPRPGGSQEQTQQGGARRGHVHRTRPARSRQPQETRRTQQQRDMDARRPRQGGVEALSPGAADRHPDQRHGHHRQDRPADAGQQGGQELSFDGVGDGPARQAGDQRAQHRHHHVGVGDDDRTPRPETFVGDLDVGETRDDSPGDQRREGRDQPSSGTGGARPGPCLQRQRHPDGDGHATDDQEKCPRAELAVRHPPRIDHAEEQDQGDDATRNDDPEHAPAAGRGVALGHHHLSKPGRNNAATLPRGTLFRSGHRVRTGGRSRRPR